jgi:hypothetical protein
VSVQPPRNGWNILGAIFLIVGGLLLVLLGGSCSLFFGASMAAPGAGDMWPLLLLSLGTLVGGLALLLQAIKILRK